MIPAGYIPVPFPAWRHHATQEPRLVTSQAESDALGPGWEDSPAKCVAPSAADQKQTDAQPVDAPISDAAAELHRTKVADVVAIVLGSSDADKLTAAAQMERQNPKVEGGRMGVLRAIEARLAQLAQASTEATVNA